VNAGTPEALRPISEEVLQWVERQRSGLAELRRPTPDELRRIELMALAVGEWSLFLTLYGLSPEETPDGLRAPR